MISDAPVSTDISELFPANSSRLSEIIIVTIMIIMIIIICGNSRIPELPTTYYLRVWPTGKPSDGYDKDTSYDLRVTV